MMPLIALWGFAYLVGAVPTTYLIAKAVGGIDLRSRGSGNVGASNLASQLGKHWFPVVGAIELARGGGPILLGHFALGLEAYGWALSVTPLFTIIGNNWSPFLRFTGGRGVGVWSGGLLAMSPPGFLVALMPYLLGWWATRRSAECLAVVLATYPLVCLLLPQRWLLAGAPEQLAAIAASGAVLIFIKRITSNGEGLAQGVPAIPVLINRLLRDRDIPDRSQWLSRQLD